MSLYAIGDLHLSLGGSKSMEVFGGRWEDYVRKLSDGFSGLCEDDLTVLCGDISWGMSMEESLEDFLFIDRLPGKKLIIKGNHDYWWSTASKAKRFFADNGITTIDILHNNSFAYKDVGICGTRGWFYEELKGDAHDRKIMQRENMRLEASLKSAGEGRKFVFLHYPPKYLKYDCPDILRLLDEYGVELCCYGHLHAASCACSFNGKLNDTQFRLVSADYVNFTPQKLL